MSTYATTKWRTGRTALALAAFLALGACAAPTHVGHHAEFAARGTHDDPPIQVLTTTGIIADLVRNVGGDLVNVISLVPENADPHSYEPNLRDIRNIVYADLAFSNYLMLEEQNLIKSLDTNLRVDVPNIALAEAAVKYAAEIIPLVEDISLDTAWLGLRVQGDASNRGGTRASHVAVTATNLRGPGRLAAYLTGTFGEVAHYFDSVDGFDETDVATLPTDAHTHLSWAFTEPGYYELDLRADFHLDDEDAEGSAVAQGTVHFAVGVDPYDTPNVSDPFVLNAGHSDITVNLDEQRFQLLLDHEHSGTQERHRDYLDLDQVVVEVPTKALHQLPSDPTFRFLGRAGTQVYQLPQAVLGKHVHGDIDPHLWQDVGNGMVYAEIIRDTLIEVDPTNAAQYTANTKTYLAELEALDTEIQRTIDTIPQGRRILVTTHDAFGYFAHAYGMTVAGFVTPNPASEPSIAERKRLTQTIRDLEVPAVVLEPNLVSRSSTLVEVAREQGVAVCPIYGDTFTPEVRTYVDMMRFNAQSLTSCLTEGPTAPEGDQQ
jgi:anchored repeat ABC transporter substrate-binding protein